MKTADEEKELAWMKNEIRNHYKNILGDSAEVVVFKNGKEEMLEDLFSLRQGWEYRIWGAYSLFAYQWFWVVREPLGFRLFCCENDESYERKLSHRFIEVLKLKEFS